MLVESLTNENLELSDIAFAFEGGSHTEEVTTSTWTEIGSSSGASGITRVTMTYNESTYSLTLSATTEEIFNLLQNGIVIVTGKYFTMNYNAIIIDGSYYDNKYDFCIFSNIDCELCYNSDDDTWDIQIPE